MLWLQGNYNTIICNSQVDLFRISIRYSRWKPIFRENVKYHLDKQLHIDYQSLSQLEKKWFNIFSTSLHSLKARKQNKTAHCKMCSSSMIMMHMTWRLGQPSVASDMHLERSNLNLSNSEWIVCEQQLRTEALHRNLVNCPKFSK